MAKSSNIKNSTTNNQHKTHVDGDSTINRRRMLKMTTATAIASVSANSISSNGTLAAAALAASETDHETADGLATDHVCTAEEAAAINFEPWVDCQKPPTNEQWIKAINPYLVTARIAWVTCQKTKDELVKVIDDLGEKEEVWDEFYKGLKDAQQFFQYFHDLFEKAELRIICAGSVIELRDEGEASA